MKAGFVEAVADALLADGTLDSSDSVLALCAGRRERNLLAERGFSRATITNLDEPDDALAPFEWSREDAQALRFENGSFDFALVVAGLHHCASPHRALVEMYRVARKGILVIEARDSLLTRAAVRLGLASEYELSAVAAHGYREGGVDNTSVPNFIYRWTEAEFRKAIRSADPSGEPSFRFFYALDVPHSRPAIASAAEPVLSGLARVFPRLSNTIAMVALRPRALWPWLAVRDGEVVFDRRHAG
jgi:SAM-dependent methyltransferase